MMGVGKSNAKIYVRDQKRQALHLRMWQVRMKRKESLQEVVDFLHNPWKYTEHRSEASERSTVCRTSGNR